MRKSLLALVLLAAASFVQADVQLKEGHPDRYTVVRGDTLWDISGKFLREPWKWPEIWQANPQIQNPHLIYPGDQLSLVYVNGQPRLTLNRGDSHGTIKLSPTIRSTPIADAIPTIPLGAVNAFLLSNRIIDNVQEFDNAPHILAGDNERVISGAGDKIYARGNLDEQQRSYGIFRKGKDYIDPKTKELLGINADDVGTASMVAVDKDVATMTLSRTTQEVRPGDRLFPTEERAINSTFQPSEPTQKIDGEIIDVPRGVTQIGEMDVVTLNRGARDGLAAGSVLAVYQAGELVRDRVDGTMVQVPDVRAGLVMVFRTYQKLSYGLVLNASRSMSVHDKVRNP